MTTISGLRTADIRFPTSMQLDGSDAMNPDPDYSAAYVVVQCDDGSEGYGFTFTTGPGNDVQLAATTALAPLVVGRPVDTLVEDLGEIGRVLTHEPHLRWLGPEKGIVHMGIGAVLNALWDLAARRAGTPVWRLLAELSPDALVDLVDFRYLTDALTPAEAADLLRAAEPGRAERTAHLLQHGFPAYATTPGWLGYSDDKLVRLTQEAVADGFPLVKLKVGADIDDDIRRLGLTREAVGPDVLLAVDANQRWDAADAVAWMHRLAPFDPYWIEEPTSPDDILAHRAIREQLAPIRVASGEHIHNRVMVKQFLQAGALDVLQLDAARVGGVNENVAILLLAAKFGVPVCPHAGGVGLCELVQHLAMFDYAAVAGRDDDRMIEYVDHLHEHFEDPVVIRSGRYVAPTRPGFSARILDESIATYEYPGGTAWTVSPAGV